MKYLVTGGAGFIGSNIVEELVKRGENVRVLDDLSTGKEANLAPFMDKIEFCKGDIRNNDNVRKAVKGMDYVIHQAAFLSVAGSIEDPLLANDINVNGTLNLLVCCRGTGVRRVVNASTSSVYGNCSGYPQSELFAPDPVSPYAVSKLAAEYYMKLFNDVFGVETVSLRYFNVFGPRQNPASKYSSVIPAFISRLMDDKPCVIDGSGTQRRDFIFVSDVVEANMRAAEAPKAAGTVINVGCGTDNSIKDIVDELRTLMKKKIGSEYGPRRAGDVDRTIADIGLMKDLLKVFPRVGFHEGLERTVEWFRKKKTETSNQ